METKMNPSKKKRLEANGWKVGSTTDFLKLSPEETAYIELKLALSRGLQDLRKSKNLTQVDLAKRLKSSQSRVAKMEAADTSVAVDLIFRSLFALGASLRETAHLLSATAHTNKLMENISHNNSSATTVQESNLSYQKPSKKPVASKKHVTSKQKN